MAAENTRVKLPNLVKWVASIHHGTHHPIRTANSNEWWCHLPRCQFISSSRFHHPIQSNPIQSNPIQSKRTLLAASSEMNQVETTKRERNQVRKCRLLGQNGETFNYQVRGHETDGAHEQEEDGVGIISGHVTKDSTAALFLSFSFYWIFFYSSGSKWKYSDADSDFCTLFLFPPLCLFAVMYIYIYIYLSLSLFFFLSI